MAGQTHHGHHEPNLVKRMRSFLVSRAYFGWVGFQQMKSGGESHSRGPGKRRGVGAGVGAGVGWVEGGGGGEPGFLWRSGVVWGV